MRTLLMLPIIFFIGSASAEQKNFAAMGWGTSTCAQFANLYRVDPTWAENNYFIWAQGFLSGWNLAQALNKKPFLNLALMDNNAQKAYLRSYCDDRPLKDYVDAVMDLIFRLEALSAR